MAGARAPLFFAINCGTSFLLLYFLRCRFAKTGFLPQSCRLVRGPGLGHFGRRLFLWGRSMRSARLSHHLAIVCTERPKTLTQSWSLIVLFLCLLPGGVSFTASFL